MRTFWKVSGLALAKLANALETLVNWLEDLAETCLLGASAEFAEMVETELREHEEEKKEKAHD